MKHLRADPRIRLLPAAALTTSREQEDVADRILQAGVGMALRIIDPPRWLRVNRKLCHIVGCTREELLEVHLGEYRPVRR